MKLAIMQPYFMPYIGYFQLLKSVDRFIIYDNIKYTKKGWINRNRILKNGQPDYISISLQKDSDSLNIVERRISSSFNKHKMLNQIKESYRKSPYFSSVFPLIEKIINNDEKNLFLYLLNQIELIKEHLMIETEILISSKVEIEHSLKAEDKVLAICKEQQANIYINAIGGQELYSKDLFLQNDINLYFIKTNDIIYKQFTDRFTPNLSIVDVLMFNSPESINEMLDDYVLI